MNASITVPTTWVISTVVNFILVFAVIRLIKSQARRALAVMIGGVLVISVDLFFFGSFPPSITTILELAKEFAITFIFAFVIWFVARVR